LALVTHFLGDRRRVALLESLLYELRPVRTSSKIGGHLPVANAVGNQRLWNIVKLCSERQAEPKIIIDSHWERLIEDTVLGEQAAFDDGGGKANEIVAKKVRKDLSTEPFWVLYGNGFSTASNYSDLGKHHPQTIIAAKKIKLRLELVWLPVII